MSRQLVVIGTITTPYPSITDCPRQPWTQPAISTLHIAPAYRDAVTGLAPGIRAHVLWWADRADRTPLRRRQHPGGPPLGVLAGRGVLRPNPIGLTLAEITAVDDLAIEVRGMDCTTDTPLLDIKPAIELPYQ